MTAKEYLDEQGFDKQYDDYEGSYYYTFWVDKMVEILEDFATLQCEELEQRIDQLKQTKNTIAKEDWEDK